MMPMKPVTLHRWQIVVAFFAITLAYVLGLFAIQHQRTITRHETQARLGALHRIAIESCRSRHKIVIAVRTENQALLTFLRRTLAPSTGTVSPPQRRGIKNLAQLRLDLSRAEALGLAADCRGVSPLPK